jgi:hypothetical protein
VRSRTRVALVALAALVTVLVPAARAAGPVVNYTITIATPGDNGWYRSNVTVTITVSGATDTTCPAAKTFVSNSDVLNCTATDGTSTIGFQLRFKIDKDVPTVTGAAASRGPDSNDWYRAPVGIAFSGSDATSGIASCTQATYGGPDSGGTTVTGACRDNAGNTSAAAGFGMKYDATPPNVTASLERAPDANGWYNHPVKLNLSGGDALSGVTSCDAPVYGGPDDAAASIGGSCRDAAGNSASQTVALRYDATPPTLTKLAAASTNGAVTLRWTASPDTMSLTLVRTPMKKGGKDVAVYRGKAPAFTDRGLTNGLRYRYTLAGADVAGNVATAQTFAVPRALIKPAEGSRLEHLYPPTLTWFAKAKATYYNVQVFRGRVKVLSAWPTTTKLKLKRSWRYNGRTIRFTAGRYRWYVWPGLGARKANRYGKLHGGSFFFVR